MNRSNLLTRSQYYSAVMVYSTLIRSQSKDFYQFKVCRTALILLARTRSYHETTLA